MSLLLEPPDEFFKLMERIRAWDLDRDPGQMMFMGWPDRWFVKPLFRCENGHVRSGVLLSEALGRDACFACRGRTAITCPEDEEGRLW